MPSRTATLQEIPPDRIDANPDNPRIIFREAEMQELMDSIAEVGVKVPVSLYPEAARFVLIDGERRWRCAKRLNLKTLPAIVQPKPTKLENLLMMFNIHNVRVDWDPMPMALKLGQVSQLLQVDGKATNAKALAGVTGVPLASVRRALDLLELPQKFQRMLLSEAQKPRAEQKIKADLFIEVYKSLHAVERHAPEVFQDVSKPQYIDSMVQKYVNGVVDNVVAYREVSRIARAELAGVDKEAAIPVLVHLVQTKGYSIKDAYRDTVEAAYERRDLVTRLNGLADRLSAINSAGDLDTQLRGVLGRVREEINRLLG
jgi:ParB family chromosome partitioning protein